MADKIEVVSNEVSSLMNQISEYLDQINATGAQKAFAEDERGALRVHAQSIIADIDKIKEHPVDLDSAV